MSPGQDPRQHLPAIVCLSARCLGALVAPLHEDAVRAAVAHARQREVTEFLSDNLDQLDIVGLLARRQVIQIRAGLKFIHHGQERALARLGLGRGGSFVGRDEFGISRLARQGGPPFQAH